MKKRNKVLVDGKSKDYEEVSNMAQTDLVPIMKAADHFMKLCSEQEIPCLVVFSPKTLMPMTAGVYDTDWDDNKQRRLACLVGGLIKYLRERLWVYVKFERFGPPTT